MINKKKLVALAGSVLALSASALAWTNYWYNDPDVWSTPTSTNFPIVKSRTITASATQVRTIFAASPYNGARAPGIRIECVSASTGAVAWSEDIPCLQTGNRIYQTGVRSMGAGTWYVRIRAKANQFAGDPNNIQVVVGKTEWWW